MKRTPSIHPGGSRQRRAFTLIELLVVLAVVAVLMALLLPSLGKARALAKRIRCGANLKQLALAWNAYLIDSNGRFYQDFTANVSYGGWRGIKGWWPRPLNPYVGLADPNSATEHSAKVFYCPADKGGIPGAFLRDKAYQVNGTSYQTNIFLIGQDNCQPFSEQTRELDLAIAERLPNLAVNRVAKNHSQLLLIGDFGWINQWKPRPHPRPEWKELAEWHGKADCHNVAFLDGHMALLKIRKGYYVRDEYWVLPFEDLSDLAREVQGPAQ
jgi:prepilin-type N-terminal cleavage/methylation domain-containing protein